MTIQLPSFNFIKVEETPVANNPLDCRNYALHSLDNDSKFVLNKVIYQSSLLNSETMATKIFVNLPVNDLQKSIGFFTKLGFTFNPQFTDETATCMIIGENIFAMLITKERFKEFTKKEICDATRSTEVLIALDAENREKVDEMVQKAVAAGGSTYADPKDYGWMYYHSFADLDGHQWELMYMDESAVPAAPAKESDITTTVNS